MNQLPEWISELMVGLSASAGQAGLTCEMQLDGMVMKVEFPNENKIAKIIPSWTNYSQILNVELENYDYLQLFVEIDNFDIALLNEENLSSIPYSFGQDPTLSGDLAIGFRHHIEITEDQPINENELFAHCFRMIVHANLFD
jgi:hypothetical protein